MIRSLDLSEKLDFDGALYVRVRSFLDSYGTGYGFARFWVQYDGDEQTSLLFLMDECLTVICNNGVDDELLAFISALGAKSLLCNVPIRYLNGTEASVFEKINDFEKITAINLDYRNVYDRLSSAFEMPHFEAWYVDICHRVRHESAVIFADEYSAGCAAVGGAEALITGVCVDKHYRREGLGRRAVDRLAALSGSVKIYALSDSNDNDRFYLSCGFVKTGKIFQYILGEYNGTEFFQNIGQAQTT